MTKKFILCCFLLLYILIYPSSAQQKFRNTSLKVGVYQNHPKIFINDAGQPDGIFIDVLKEIATKGKFKLNYVYGDWPVLFNMLSNGEIDILPDMAYTPKRDSLFNFNHLSVINTWIEIYTTQDNSIHSLNEIQGKRIGLLKDSYQEELLTTHIKKKFNLTYDIFHYNDYESTKNALINNDVDMIVVDRFFYFSAKFDPDVTPTGIVFQPNELYFGFNKHIDPALLSFFDHMIAQLKNNPKSTYFISLQKWLDINQHEHGIPLYLKWVIVIISIITTLAFCFIVILRKTVKAKTKELMVAKVKAEESDHLKTVFLQNISHEIRTPMNGILGFIDLLDNDDLIEIDRKKYLDIVKKSGNRLLHTINDVIEISKIESNQIILHKSEVHLEQFMLGLFRFFNNQAAEKKITLSMDTPLTDNYVLIETDKSLLEKILINLLKNAIKFTTTGSINFGFKIKDDMLEFYVKDTGCGIPVNRQNAIYDRFVQSDLDITRAHEGSGLGLAISKAYIEMLGGKIWVESEINKGSTFYFTTPYKPVKQQERKSENNPVSFDSLSKPLNILIAEDDEISFLYLENLLLHKNIHTIRACDGLETLEKLNSITPDIDILLLDIRMPGISGIEVAQKIRKNNDSIPIIAQTAYAFAEERIKIQKAGFNDIISKPINKHELIKTILKYANS
ncbi:MAG: transporter substrate-binding domain-containing protein [Paludibacter sp.]|nr:transporter substrate-binding domain-containing protein [Paludibacter sp.]